MSDTSTMAEIVNVLQQRAPNSSPSPGFPGGRTLLHRQSGPRLAAPGPAQCRTHVIRISFRVTAIEKQKA